MKTQKFLLYCSMLKSKNILNKDQHDKIVELLNNLKFEGITTNKDESLFKFGYVYNSETGKLIMTSPEYVWNELGGPIKFGIKTVSQDDMIQVFEKHKEEILEYNNGIGEDEWLMFCDSFKLSDLLKWEDNLGVVITDMTLTSDDLIEFLENYGG